MHSAAAVARSSTGPSTAGRIAQICYIKNLFAPLSKFYLPFSDMNFLVILKNILVAEFLQNRH